jgi:hypothetical protein
MSFEFITLENIGEIEEFTKNLCKTNIEVLDTGRKEVHSYTYSVVKFKKGERFLPLKIKISKCKCVMVYSKIYSEKSAEGKDIVLDNRIMIDKEGNPEIFNAIKNFYEKLEVTVREYIGCKGDDKSFVQTKIKSLSGKGYDNLANPLIWINIPYHYTKIGDKNIKNEKNFPGQIGLVFNTRESMQTEKLSKPSYEFLKGKLKKFEGWFVVKLDNIAVKSKPTGQDLSYNLSFDIFNPLKAVPIKTELSENDWDLSEVATYVQENSVHNGTLEDFKKIIPEEENKTSEPSIVNFQNEEETAN